MTTSWHRRVENCIKNHVAPVTSADPTSAEFPHVQQGVFSNVAFHVRDEYETLFSLIFDL